MEKNYKTNKMKPQIKPTAMPCTEEQWLNEMKPLCDKHGLEYKNIGEFIANTFLVNNYKNSQLVSNMASTYNTLIPYHPELFMYNSGIFPEKWAVRGSKEFRVFAIKQGLNMSSVNGTFNDRFYYLDSENEIHTTPIPKDAPPTDYVEVTLEELMFHYEQKTNDMTTEQPKWEDITSKDCLIEEIIDYHNHKIAKLVGVSVPVIFNDKGSSYYVDYGNLIPYNPLKAQLLAEKEELKKRIEEIDKQLK